MNNLIDLDALQDNPAALLRWAAEHAEAFRNGRDYGRLEGYEQARALLAPIAQDLAYQLHASDLDAQQTAQTISRLFQVHLNRTRYETTDPADDHRLAA
jgi:hypothetical protein